MASLAKAERAKRVRVEQQEQVEQARPEALATEVRRGAADRQGQEDLPGLREARAEAGPRERRELAEQQASAGRVVFLAPEEPLPSIVRSTVRQERAST